MKKLFTSLAMLACFFVANAQTGVSLSIETSPFTYTLASGQLFCLTDNIVSKGFKYTIIRQSGEIFYGNLYLVFKDAYQQKHEVMVTSISDANFSSGSTSYSATWSQNLSNNSDGITGIYGTFANGTAYLLFRNSMTSNEISSSSNFTFQRNPLSVPSTASYCPSNPIIPASITASGCSTYSWSPATGLNTTTGATVQASAVATYTVTGTINGCTTTKTVSVTKKNDLAVAPTSTTTCPNQSTTLTASGSTTYSWTPSTGLNTTTGATVISTPASSVTYTVTGTKNGCVQQKTVTVNTLSPCGSTLANAINLGSFYTCPMIYTAVYNNSTTNNYGNDYGTNKPNGQASDDIYFKIYYDSYQGEGTMLTVSTSTGDPTYTDFDTYIHLLDANGNWLQSNDNTNSSTLLSNISRQIFENYYYIVVEGKAAASGNFSLFINVGSDCARIGNLDESTTDGAFSISPNPASDYITVTLPASDVDGEISIYTMEGTLAKNIATAAQSNKISVADLTPGFYLVKIKQGTFIKTEKIIVQ